MGCAHCVHEFKKAPRRQDEQDAEGEDDPDEDDPDEEDYEAKRENAAMDLPIYQQIINDKLRVPRGYIEHTFAEMKKTTSLDETAWKKDWDVLGQLMKFWCDTEFILVEKGLRTARYEHKCVNRPVAVPVDPPPPLCQCHNNAQDKARSIEAAKAYRLNLMRFTSDPLPNRVRSADDRPKRRKL